MPYASSILVRVVLLQLSGYGNCQDDATPIFSSDSKSSVLVLSNDTSFVSGFFGKMVKEPKIFYWKLACTV